MPSSSYTSGPTTVLARPTKYQERTRTWVNTPNYSTTDRSLLPINQYTDDRGAYDQDPTIRQTRNPTTGAVSTSTIGLTSIAALKSQHQTMSAWLGYAVTDSSLANDAAISCLMKLADMKVNLAVTGAEAAKTSSLILGKANQLYRAYRSFRRGNFKEVAGILNLNRKTVHKTWLEYKYGWMPLLMEVKGAAELLAQHHLGRPIRFSATGTKVFEETKERKLTEPTAPYWSGTEYGKGTRTYRVKIEAEITNPHISALQQMGLTNPALVAWELVPFSFVFDWFISVGSWLQALSALHGITVRRAMISRVSERSFEYVSTYHPQRVSSTYEELGCRYIFRSSARSYSRDKYYVDNTALYPPVNNDPFSWNRLITGLALLRTLARR